MRIRSMHPMPICTSSTIVRWSNQTHEYRTSDGTSFRATKVAKSKRYDPPRRSPGQPEWRNITSTFDGWTITVDRQVAIRTRSIRHFLLMKNEAVDRNRDLRNPSVHDAKRLARILAEEHETRIQTA